jgi:glycosyltransferase involved in cell wall biosynthesis
VLSRSSQRFETLRSLSAAVSALRPAFRACVSKATSVVAAENETASFLQRFRGSNDVQVLCPAFFAQSQVDWFTGAGRKNSIPRAPLRIFGGGNLEGRKGVAMALHALARLKAKGILATYVLGGGGPEQAHLEQLAGKLGISEAVLFSGGFSGDEYRKQLAQTDIYLLPSLRETAGITMMEAMLAGCYPIVLAGTGAGDIVAKTGGATLTARNPEEAISMIAEQLEWCHFHRVDMAQRARDAAVQIRALYSKDAYQKVIRETYTEALEKHRQKLRRK